MTPFFTALLALVLVPIGFLVTGSPVAPEEAHSLRQPLGAFLLFAGWVLCGFSWGELIRRPLRLAPSHLERLALGSLFFAAVAALLAVARLLSFSFFPLHLAIVIAGPLALASLEAKNKKVRPVPLEKRDFPPELIFLSLAFLFLLFQAAFPSSEITPLWQTLRISRALVMQGGVTSLDTIPSAWNFLHLWPQLLLGGPGERGLITAQIFSQWTHVMFGGALAALSLHRIFRSMSEGNDHLAWLAVLAGIVAPALTAVMPLASSEWGAIAWVLYGLSLAHLQKRYLSGCTVLGLGVAAGTMNLFFAIPLLIMIAVSHWQDRSFRPLGKTFLGFALGLAPLVPLAVSHPDVFPFSHWRDALRSIEYKNGFLFSNQSVFIPLALIAPLVFWFLRKFWSRSGYFALALWFGLLWFLLSAGPKTNPLHLAAGIPLLAGFGAVSLGRLAKIWRPDSMQSSYAFIVVAIALLIAAKFPLMNPLHAAQLRDLSAQVYAHPSGRTEAWIRNHVEIGTPIASVAEARLYYLSGHSVIRVWDDKELSSILKEKSLKDGLQELEARGIHYLLDTSDLAGLKVHRPFLEALWEVVNKQRSVIVFQTQEARVIDLPALVKRIQPRKH